MGIGSNTKPEHKDVSLSDVPAIPTRCPNCGDDREVPRLGTGERARTLQVTSRERMRSSIGRSRATHDRVSQILAEHLLRTVYTDHESQQLVAFSDSRQDAARLNASLDVSHHLDSVRQLVVRFMGNSRERAEDLRLFRRFLDDPAGNDDHRERALAILERSEAAKALRSARDLIATAAERERAVELERQELAGVAPLVAVRDYVFNELLQCRTQPGRLLLAAQGRVVGPVRLGTLAGKTGAAGR